MILNCLRWIFLILAGLLAIASLLTAVRPPIGLDWRVRMIVGILVQECGVALLIVVAAVVAGAWGVSRGHWVLLAVTAGFCVMAVVLLLKPIVEERKMARELPRQLADAFRPADAGRVAFPVGRIFSGNEKPGNVETLTYAPSLKLDFYRAAGSGAAPCLINIHGGAWARGDREESPAVRRCCAWLASRGYAVASIDYRLAPGAIWPAQREDVLVSLAYLRERAEKLGIDPGKIVLMGRSAGGQLAEAVAYGAHDRGICGVIALYSPADLAYSWQSTSPSDAFNQRKILENYLGGTPESARAVYDGASGTVLAGADAPPTLLMHGELDTIVPMDQSERMSQRLEELGVRHVLIRVPWATHGFDYIRFNSPGGQVAAYSIEYFLAAVTR